MDPLTAVSLVGTIVQFVEFGSNLLSAASQIYHDGVLKEYADAEVAAKSLLELNRKLEHAAVTTGLDPALEKLCKACHTVGDELIALLSKVKVSGHIGKRKSIRAALLSVWSKDKIEALEKRLANFRMELNLRIIAELRQQVDLVSFRQLGSFNDLNDRTKEILDTIIDNQDVFKSVIDSQTAEIQQMHNAINESAAELHESTQLQIIEVVETASRQSMEQSIDNHEAIRQDLQQHTFQLGSELALTNTTVLGQHRETRMQIQIADQRNQDEHEITQREIWQLNQALRQLRDEIKRTDARFKEFITEFKSQRNQKKRWMLQKLSNAASATLITLETLYRSLQAILATLQARAKVMWGNSLIYQQSGIAETYQAQAVSTIVNSSAIPTKGLPPPPPPPPPPKRTSIKSPLDAMDLYYHYFYPHISMHDNLIDVSHMENLWGPQDLMDFSNITSHVECFSIYSSECPLPAVWLMASVIAAVQECIVPSPDTHSILAEVFEKSRHSQMFEGTFTQGSRSSRLQGDFGYWKRFAEIRGLDQAISAYLYRNKLISNAAANDPPEETPFSMLDKEEMVSFLIWLIGNEEKPKDNTRPKVLVQSARVFAAALSMQWVGIRIATQLASSENPEPVLNSCWPLVAYGEFDSQQPHAKTLDNAHRLSNLTIDFVQ